jgi:hypothetical protein
MPLSTENVREELKRRIPGLAVRFPEHAVLWTDSPPDNYALFSHALRPYLIGLLHAPGNERDLQHVFSFLEEMAGAGSFALLDILQLEIVNPLARDAKHRAAFEQHAGPNLKRLVEEARKQSPVLRVAKLLRR